MQNPRSVEELTIAVTALTLEWGLVIKQEHHKEGDCHFSIKEKWSYGDAPVYVLKHDGYIAGKIKLSFSSRQDALTHLTIMLKRMIAEEQAWKEDDAQHNKEDVIAALRLSRPELYEGAKEPYAG